MLKASRERNDEREIELWKYVLFVLDELKHVGMSDEEYVLQPIIRGGITTNKPFKAVLHLNFRNKYFRELFEVVD
jgi:hypothetical protein